MEAFTIRPLYGLNPLYQLLLTVGLAIVYQHGAILWEDRLRSTSRASVRSFLGLDYPRFVCSSCFWRGHRDHSGSPSAGPMGIVIRADMHDLETVNAFGINIYRVFVVLPLGRSSSSVSVIISSMRAINRNGLGASDQHAFGHRHRQHGLFSRPLWVRSSWV
jgi:hypothetical protein